ncbi:MAG: hypothetical protein P4L85_09430 [Paludisphaera borealis]|nr:hypothetical protein [Paludisphaera borealis]
MPARRYGGEYRIDDGFDIVEHVVVRDPKHMVSSTFEPQLPGGVVLEPIVVAAAVELDHDPAHGMEEVDDEPADRSLASELFAANAMVAERTPEPSFRGRHLAPEPSRSLDRLGFVVSLTHRASPVRPCTPNTRTGNEAWRAVAQPFRPSPLPGEKVPRSGG